MSEQQNDTSPASADEGRGREDRPRQRFEAFIPDMLRRTFYAGLGAIFTSEEGLRRLANDFSLPKDVATYLITQAQSTKNELFRIVAAEIRRFLDDLRVNEELQRLLGSLTIELKTEIRFVPHDEDLRPTFGKSRVRVKRHPRRGASREDAVPSSTPVPDGDHQPTELEDEQADKRSGS